MGKKSKKEKKMERKSKEHNDTAIMTDAEIPVNQEDIIENEPNDDVDDVEAGNRSNNEKEEEEEDDNDDDDDKHKNGDKDKSDTTSDTKSSLSKKDKKKKKRKTSSADLSSDDTTNKKDERKERKRKERESESGTDGNGTLSTTTEVNNNNNANSDKPNFFAGKNFTDLPLSDKTQTALATMKFTRMTQIQHMAIPSALIGNDIIGAAKTGSGKTLAFVVPCIELLHKAQFTSKNGTGVIIISPTRELAMQIYGVVQELYEAGKHTQTYGLLMGGANRKTEADKLSKGINLIVCTPGRLLDHLQNTKGFNIRNLLAFVMDEADRILEQGFEDDLRAILKLLPTQRQTMLYSATQTKKVEDLVRVSIDTKNSVIVDIPTETKLATAAGLEQGYVTCPSDQRFLLLFTFLKKNKGKKKIMVFFSSCNSVKFHSELLNYIDIPVMDIHGKQKQVKRTTTFFTFCKATTGILLCTDVAARGLDIPDVDWIIQYDPPDDPKEYIHRVGRTARGATGSGRALLFLTPEETGFLKYLKAASVTLNEYEFPLSKVANVQSQLQRLIESNYYLNRTARDAYRSYLLAYTSHSLRDIYNVHALDLQAVGKAFGFTTPPRVDLPIGTKDKTTSRHSNKKPKLGDTMGNNHTKYASSGHAFSASNPYGKRDESDKRQFTH